MPRAAATGEVAVRLVAWMPTTTTHGPLTLRRSLDKNCRPTPIADGPATRETTLDLWACWVAWLDEHVKNAGALERRMTPADPV
jgi:hypothetical protein